MRMGAGCIPRKGVKACEGGMITGEVHIASEQFEQMLRMVFLAQRFG